MITSQEYNEKTKELYFKVLVKQDEDIYDCYNLISIGDQLTTTAVRNVVHESNSGSTEKTRTKFTVTITVERIDFDSEQHSLRVLGITFSVLKEYPDESLFELLKELTNPEPKDYIITITMQFGLANICLVSSESTLTIAHIEKSIPKKKEYVNGRDKAIISFFGDIYSSLKKQLAKLNYKTVVVIGSPGFLSGEFHTYATERASKDGEIDMLNCCHTKFATCHVSSGYKSAINEIFADAKVRTRLGHLKVYDQVLKLESFMNTLRENEDKCCYDSLYKVNDPIGRNRIKSFMAEVESFGGQVCKFSARHHVGQELDNYTGIAAILHFPIPNLSELVHPEDLHKPHTQIVNTKEKPTQRTKKTKDEEAAEAFAKSLIIGSLTIADESKEYDEFDQWDELDEVADDYEKVHDNI